MGFEDGQALIQLAWVERHLATSRQQDTALLVPHRRAVGAKRRFSRIPPLVPGGDK
jgi:hypothetical protein